MTFLRLRPLFAVVIGAVLVFGIARMAQPPVPDVSAMDRTEVLKLLGELEKECDPDSPSNDYAWASNAPPTERHRRLIIERLHGLRDATLVEVGHRLQTQRPDEFGEIPVSCAGEDYRSLIARMGRTSLSCALSVS